MEARITAGVSGPKTRAVDNGWNADRIGVMVVDAPGTTTTMGGKYKNVGYATTSTGTNADFTPMTAGGGIFFEDAFLEFTFAAYAPYASGANASTLPGTDGKITVNTSNQAAQLVVGEFQHGSVVETVGVRHLHLEDKTGHLVLEGAVAAARGGVVREADGRAVFIGLGSRGMDVVHLLLFRDRGQRCERLDVTPVHRCPEDGHGQVRGNL